MERLSLGNALLETAFVAGISPEGEFTTRNPTEIHTNRASGVGEPGGGRGQSHRAGAYDVRANRADVESEHVHHERRPISRGARRAPPSRVKRDHGLGSTRDIDSANEFRPRLRLWRHQDGDCDGR